MRRLNWKTVSTLVTMFVVAGCQDNTVSAPQGTSAAPVPMMMAPGGSPQLSLNGKAKDNDDVDFAVSEKGGVYVLGNHAIVFPAHSICNPERSTYGPGTWDSACTASRGPVKVHATIRSAKAGIWIDFKPSLRFVPSNDSRRWVYIYMYSPQVIGAPDLSRYSILYASAIGAKGVDDAVGDATLRTYVDLRGGITMRRIKHFSGYATSSAFDCDPTADPTCLPAPEP